MSEKAELSGRISKLKDSISARQQSQKDKRTKVYSTIADKTRELLRNDLQREDSFIKAESVNFSFGDNEISVDGKRIFSASSMVYLKNSFHLALHLASLQESFLRYPRFSLFDNIEDKGMELERSHNFQRQLVNSCDISGTEHQLIYTTSMIAPELDTPKYTVGDFYTHENRSLRISS